LRPRTRVARDALRGEGLELLCPVEGYDHALVVVAVAHVHVSVAKERAEYDVRRLVCWAPVHADLVAVGHDLRGAAAATEQIDGEARDAFLGPDVRDVHDGRFEFACVHLGPMPRGEDVAGVHDVAVGHHDARSQAGIVARHAEQGVHLSVVADAGQPGGRRDFPVGREHVLAREVGVGAHEMDLVDQVAVEITYAVELFDPGGECLDGRLVRIDGLEEVSAVDLGPSEDGGQIVPDEPEVHLVMHLDARILVREQEHLLVRIVGQRHHAVHGHAMLFDGLTEPFRVRFDGFGGHGPVIRVLH